LRPRTQPGLPPDPDELAAPAPRSCARLAAALINVSLDYRLREQLTRSG
jgi:hypothetical protein